jgi:hypothetical protein
LISGIIDTPVSNPESPSTSSGNASTAANAIWSRPPTAKSVSTQRPTSTG